MMTMMLVNCSNCRTPLQLPPGAQSICCAICHAITNVAPPPDPRAVPPTAPAHGNNYGSATPPPAAGPARPPAHGRKRAVICGISYRYSRHQLKGCIKDAKCMKYLLVNRFKFTS